MGILVGDTKTFSSGISLTGWVATIKGSIRDIQKLNVSDSVIYRIYYRVFFYANQLAYVNKATPLESEVVETVDITEEQLGTNLFQIIYGKIGSVYQDVTQI